MTKINFNINEKQDGTRYLTAFKDEHEIPLYEASRALTGTQSEEHGGIFVQGDCVRRQGFYVADLESPVFVVLEATDPQYFSPELVIENIRHNMREVKRAICRARTKVIHSFTIEV